MQKITPNILQNTPQPRHFNYGDKIINKKYTILYRIADEVHSKVYSLSTTKNTRDVVRAIKLQSQNVQFPQISNEVNIIRKIFLQNQFQAGYPRLYEYGASENHNYMITRLLGPNLAVLHKLCNNRCNPTTCLLVGLQMLDRIEKIHQLGYVYRDLRLSNFCIGFGSQSPFIYMADFGHCMRFRNKETGSHIPYREGNSNLEEMTFMSIYIHNNVHYTRRDDIESLLYLIIHMFKAKLPWSKVEAKTKKQKDEKIAQIKKGVSPSYLATDFGLQMADLLWYIRSVNYYEKPDYDFIRSKLYTMVMAKTGIKEIQIKYDWNEREEIDYTIYTGQPKIYLMKKEDKDHQDSNRQEENGIDQMVRNNKRTRGRSSYLTFLVESRQFLFFAYFLLKRHSIANVPAIILQYQDINHSNPECIINLNPHTNFFSSLYIMLQEQATSQNINEQILQKAPLGPDPSKERFAQLLKKLQELNKCIQTTQSFQKFYNIIGLTRQTVIAGLQAIYEYFLLLGRQIDDGLIRKHVGNRLIEGVHSYLELQKFSDLDKKDKALYILEFETKFSVCLQFFHTVKYQQSNITSEEQAKYSHVWKHIEFVTIGDKKQIQKQYNSLKKMLTLTTTAVITEQEVDWFVSKKIFFGLSYPRYYVDYATARLKSFIFYKYPTIKLAKSIWNIPELGASKQLIKIVFDNITLNKKIYIPIECSENEYPNIFEEGSNKIQVRILNHEQLYFKTKPAKKSFLPCCTEDHTRDYREIDTIMIHMHGGGFIALSSRMMQTMTRKWANQLKIPIFSIDYRKPPNDPFPAAPNDCLAVYKFIVSKIKKYMNINPVNIYLAGDSAGGNLACSLMGSILKHNLPSPKGIYLAYPAVDLRIQFTPSKIHAVTDPLLWPSMLMLCLNEYLGGNVQNSTNPLASPVLLTQEYVGGQPNDKRFPLKWPKTIISVGQLDPMYDDSLLLMQKMRESNIDCKCRVYKDISHGFLSTDMMVSECALTLRDSIKDLKELIGFEQKKKPKKSTSSKSQKEIPKCETNIKRSQRQLIQETDSSKYDAENQLKLSHKFITQQKPNLEDKLTEG